MEILAVGFISYFICSGLMLLAGSIDIARQENKTRYKNKHKNSYTKTDLKY